MSADSRLPRYAQLRDALASRIADQEWGPGAKIPSEQVLAGFYGVSIHTLRKGIELLVTEGLLERKQGSGTYVRQPSFDGLLFRWFNFEDTSAETRTVPQSILYRRSVVDAPDIAADKLRISRGTKVVQLLRLRLWTGEPVVMEELYLPYPKYKPILTMEDYEIGPLLYPVYAQQFGDVVAAVEDELTLGKADVLEAGLLQIAVGEPVVIVDRTSLSALGRPIEWRRAYGRGDRFRYRVRLT